MKRLFVGLFAGALALTSPFALSAEEVKSDTPKAETKTEKTKEYVKDKTKKATAATKRAAKKTKEKTKEVVDNLIAGSQILAEREFEMNVNSGA